jgi:hypothetical protein
LHLCTTIKQLYLHGWYLYEWNLSHGAMIDALQVHYKCITQRHIGVNFTHWVTFQCALKLCTYCNFSITLTMSHIPCEYSCVIIVYSCCVRIASCFVIDEWLVHNSCAALVHHSRDMGDGFHHMSPIPCFFGLTLQI